MIKLQNLSLVENDIFFDHDVIGLLKLIRDCKRPNGFEVVKFQDFYCLFDKKNNSITNFYQSAATPEFYRKFLNMANHAKAVGVKCKFEFFITEEFTDLEKTNLFNTKEKSAIVNLEKYDIKNIKKGHRQNIQKAQKNKVNIEIFHNSTVDESLIKEFYDSVLFSRNSFGKAFQHTYKTFLFRKLLIQNGKAALVVSEHENKKSFVFSLTGKNNSFYYDSGYTSGINPFIAHYAQHSLMLYLKSLGGKYYNLGKINNVEARNNSNIKNDKVDYYKSGFCDALTDIFIPQ
jgi:hypothetical protein